MRHSSGEVSGKKWRGAPFLILSAAFAFFTWRSWRCWPDVLVDFGHELYIPWRMTEGDRLYESIAFTMGPLSQSFNALLFQIFGVSLNTLIGANLVILAAITTLLYEIFRRCGTRGTATAAVLFFLAVFAFSQYTKIGNYNYVCPYRHEVTHGLALGLLELYCLIRFAERQNRRWLIAAGLSLGLVALTKGEPLLPALACAGMAIFLGRVPTANAGPPQTSPAAPQEKSPIGRKSLRDGLTLVGSAAVAPLLALLMFTASRGWAGAWNATFGWVRFLFDRRLTTESGFYQSLAGWDAAWERSASIFLAVAGYGAGLVVAYVAEALLGRFAKRRAFAITLGLLTAFGAPYLAAPVIMPTQWSLLAGALPALLPIVVILTGQRLMNGSPRPAAKEQVEKTPHGGSQGSPWPLYLTSVYALCLLPKIFLNPQWGHYGFVLTMPATLVLIHVTIYNIPNWLRQKHMPARAFTAVAAGLLGSCALIQCLLWDRAYQAKTEQFGEGADRFYVTAAFDERTTPTLQTLDFLKRTLRPGETLVVIPEGTTLNYALRARNPTPYLMFSPWEFEAHGGEAVVEESVIESRPDYFVVVTMDMSIHGRGNFGDPGFGAGLLQFIKDDYQLVDAHVSPDESFQSAVFQRKPER